MSAARAVLQGAPQAAGPDLEASAAAFGLQLPDEAHDPAPDLVDLWAEHVDAVVLFRGMRTQLRYSMRGVEGFDYTPLPTVQRSLGLRPATADARADLFMNLQVMERALIDWYREA